MNIKGLLIAASLAFPLLTGQAMAEDATLNALQGKVLLQELGSDRYTPANVGDQVSEGDRLMLMAGASVDIGYGAQCQQTYVGARMVVVSAAGCGVDTASSAGVGSAALAMVDASSETAASVGVSTSSAGKGAAVSSAIVTGGKHVAGATGVTTSILGIGRDSSFPDRPPVSP